MNLQKSQNRINELMSRFVIQVKGATAMSRTDINRISEDVLIPLFSKIYGHADLRKLDVSESSNFPAIDLGDKETRTAYQITSKRDSGKIKKTLEKFVAHELYKEYDRLVIYVLTEKQSRYQGKGFDEIIQGKFSFNKNEDILDYQDLLREISGFCLDKSREVENILEQHFGEGQGDDKPQSVLDWLEQVNNLWEAGSGTIKINREGLRNDLRDFALRGNGVVIGGPGVGKTYLLKEFHRHLKLDEIQHLLLPIDQLGNGTDETLQRELLYEGDLIEYLKSVPVSDKKAILLFDAFDAARNEQRRKRFLNLIRRAIRELGNWNVVVTVRTYDAMKSQELLDLFGNPDNTEYEDKDVLCRPFTIPAFNEDEILQALEQIDCPRKIYDESSPDFKSILANPFNLWLLEKILKGLPDEELSALSQIHSEVQLFSLFWQRRIVAADNEIDRLFVLDGIAREMVKQRSLSIKQSDVRETLIQSAWDDLLIGNVRRFTS